MAKNVISEYTVTSTFELPPLLCWPEVPWLYEFSVASPFPDVVSADFPLAAVSAAAPAAASYSEHFAPALTRDARSGQEG